MAWKIFGKKKANRTVFTATGHPTPTPDPNPSEIKEYLKKDPVLASNLRQLTTSIFEEFLQGDAKKGKKVSKKRLDEFNEQLEKSGFHEELVNALPGIFWNGNMFFEVIVLNGKLKEIYMIDPETMKIEEDDYGTILGYTQRQPQQDDKFFSKEKILHIRAPSLETGAWGKSYLKPLEFTLARKEVAENYLAGMIVNLNPIIFLKLLADANEDQVFAIRNALRATREPTDPAKIIGLLQSEDIGRVDLGTTENFESIYRYIDRLNDEIIRILQVPPIVAGTVDNSNRSNSEIQERAVFGRTVHYWQNFLIMELNTKLLRNKLNITDITFEFPLIDERKQEAVITRALKLKELGFSNDAVFEYLYNHGVKVKNDFNEENEDTGVEKSLDIMPSREPRDKGGIPQNEEQRLNSRENGMEIKNNG